MIQTSERYTSPFGVFDIPADVRERAYRLQNRFGRVGYIDEWCRWQWQKRGAPTAKVAAPVVKPKPKRLKKIVVALPPPSPKSEDVKLSALSWQVVNSSQPFLAMTFDLNGKEIQKGDVPNEGADWASWEAATREAMREFRCAQPYTVRLISNQIREFMAQHLFPLKPR